MKAIRNLLSGAVVAVAALSITACSTLRPGYDAWEGHSIDELIGSWGEPDRQIELGVNYVAYTWNADNGECQRTFTVQEGTVVSFSDSDCD